MLFNSFQQKLNGKNRQVNKKKSSSCLGQLVTVINKLYKITFKTTRTVFDNKTQKHIYECLCGISVVELK